MMTKEEMYEIVDRKHSEIKRIEDFIKIVYEEYAIENCLYKQGQILNERYAVHSVYYNEFEDTFYIYLNDLINGNQISVLSTFVEEFLNKLK